ncbi:FtsX-like permease family protein [Kitasatospora sp. NPDC004240]
MVRSQLRHRPGRAVALVSAVAVATSAFTVLTGAARTQELQVRATVDGNHRSAYDILVRPRGGRTEAERQQDLVQAGFLSGIFGGITTDEWHRIEGIPGVEAAAPLAMVGYVMPSASVPVDLSAHLPADRTGRLFRVTTTTTADGGATRTPAATGYQYLTGNPLVVDLGTGSAAGSGPAEQLPSGTRVEACPAAPPVPAGPFAPAVRIGCDSTAGTRSVLDGQTVSTTVPAGPAGHRVQVPVPLLVAAVDPQAEARLSGLDTALVSGRYLGAHQGASTRDAEGAVSGPDGTTAVTVKQTTFPVLAASDSGLGTAVDVGVQLLPAADGRTPLQIGTDRLADLAGPTVVTRTITAQDAYRQLLDQITADTAHPGSSAGPTDPAASGAPAPANPGAPTAGRGTSLGSLAASWTVGPLHWSTGPDGRLRPDTVRNPPETWASLASNSPWLRVPPTNADTQLRSVTQHLARTGTDSGGVPLPAPVAVGVFDRSRLPSFNPLTAVPLGAYEAPDTRPADAAARTALGGGPLRPDGNLGGLLAQPPQLITTLDALPALTDGAFRGDLHAADPISSVRVRVADIRGTDAVSRERVRLVAQEIQRRTGLQVDVTYGSSPRPTELTVPAGAFGRPEITVTQNWVRMGVAFTVLDALDRKSLALFVLVLAVCALFVANSVAAAVRSRRTELGVLACLGWSPDRILAGLLGEVALLGLAAGVLGAAAAWPVGALSGLDVTAPRALAAVPGAVLLALLAAAPPVVRASRTRPAAAVHPAVAGNAGTTRARRISSLAAGNLRRTPGRSLLGALSVAVGTCALTVLAGVAGAFHSAVVGSLLGQAVSFQVRGIDYAAVATVVLLGALAVADVLYLGIRERAAEFAALAAAGWNDRELGRLVLAEGVLLGTLGALAGAGLGLAATAVLAGALPAALLVTAAAVAAGGVLLTAAASLVPAALLRRAPIGRLLTEE